MKPTHTGAAAQKPERLSMICVFAVPITVKLYRVFFGGCWTADGSCEEGARDQSNFLLSAGACRPREKLARSINSPPQL